MALELPTEKRSGSLTLATAKTLIYAEPGVGKTTLATKVDPDHTLLLATEPGYGAVEAFVQPILSWTDFRDVGGLLAKGDHDYRFLAVDTVEELSRMCVDHVCSELKIKHPSDLEYGKGWAAVGDEFKLRVGKLANLGYGVMFTSHAKFEEIKRPVGTTTKAVPALTGATWRFLEGFVDFIFFAERVTTEDGMRRVVRTGPSETWVAKQRIPDGRDPLPDVLALDATVIAEAIAGSVAEPATLPLEEK